MKQETKKFKIVGITEILGSLPASKSLFTDFVASKAPDGVEDEEDFVQREEKGLTVFARDPRDGKICLTDYQVKGFLKEAMNNLKASNGIVAGRKKIDNFVFISPRRIPVMHDGAVLYDEDDRLERQLRASTPLGERVTLASSEMVLDPWEAVVEITLLHNTGSAKSKALAWGAIHDALDYGFFKGLGQWRNGGFGRFRWESI